MFYRNNVIENLCIIIIIKSCIICHCSSPPVFTVNYGGLLASKDRITHYLHISAIMDLEIINNHNYMFAVTNYPHIISNWSFQLADYLRQKHTISDYLYIISNDVHIIVIVCLSCCFQRLTCVKST